MNRLKEVGTRTGCRSWGTIILSQEQTEQSRMNVFLKMLEQFVKETEGNFLKECLKSGMHSYYQEGLLS